MLVDGIGSVYSSGSTCPSPPPASLPPNMSYGQIKGGSNRHRPLQAQSSLPPHLQGNAVVPQSMTPPSTMPQDHHHHHHMHHSVNPPSSLPPLRFMMDSPTLARVERARRRLEGEPALFLRTETPVSGVSYLQQDSGAMSYSTTTITTNTTSSASSTSLSPALASSIVKRGALWELEQHRGGSPWLLHHLHLISRWKHRYFLLTHDYLHCFKRDAGKISEMGQFLFKIKLVEVEKVEWANKKRYSTVSLDLGAQQSNGNLGIDQKGQENASHRVILLRAEDGLEDWFELLEECTLSSKERRRALRIMHLAPHRAHLHSQCRDISESLCRVDEGLNSCGGSCSDGSNADERFRARLNTGNLIHGSREIHHMAWESVPDITKIKFRGKKGEKDTSERRSNEKKGKKAVDDEDWPEWVLPRVPLAVAPPTINSNHSMQSDVRSHRMSMMTDMEGSHCGSVMEESLSTDSQSAQVVPQSNWELNPRSQLSRIHQKESLRLNDNVFLVSNMDTSGHFPASMEKYGKVPGDYKCQSRQVPHAPSMGPCSPFLSNGRFVFEQAVPAGDRRSMAAMVGAQDHRDPQLLRYRERSHSDAHKLERMGRKSRGEVGRRGSYLTGRATQV
ncbi:uncharacterized protein LOC124167871 isoform X1 [Ischnura elegans]|uniref:uncharacterized protein LOC124167871 isoform X1 n=1 Tax=Ischnura elegans TaxID=197161 RepID=UPI001ED891D0|nr:uncharacterized protein LOC124167871 isoform X1 [Ischnura elegans]